MYGAFVKLLNMSAASAILIGVVHLYFTTVRKLTTVRNPTTAGLFSV